MNDMSTESNFWILKSKGSGSVFGGNEGYEDQIESHYVYDTTVKNYDKISEEDVIIITGKKYIEGFGRIEKILTKKHVHKKRYRCPVCNTQEHYERKGKEPKYKCRKKHEFDNPRIEDIVVDQFTATYRRSFIPAPPKTLAKLLDNYYIRRNRYYSIQLAKSDFFTDHFPELLVKLLVKESQNSISDVKRISIDLSEYLPSDTDMRIARFTKSITRQGQQIFREKLFRIYGTNCMLSGCKINEAIEASHINPYRGKNDNHARNGLLLRRDLHAIFDANLLGIHPDTMKVSLHPSIENSEYKLFNGKQINIERTGYYPSKEALKIRWKIFTKHCSTKN
jgi:predicted restriction endonuclease